MTQSRWDDHLLRLHSGLDLEAADVQWCMNEILSGNAEIELIKSFLIALKGKGETSEEVSALVEQSQLSRDEIGAAQQLRRRLCQGKGIYWVDN